MNVEASVSSMANRDEATSHAPSIRARLVQYTFIVLVPVVLAAGFALYVLSQTEKLTFERGARERIRALSTGIDAELRSSVTSLQAVIGASRALREGDLDGLQRELADVLLGQADWLGVSLDPIAGQLQVVASSRAGGTSSGTLQDPASRDRAVQTGTPVIGNVTPRPQGSGMSIPVRVPVKRDGVTTYVLTAEVDPTSISRLLVLQQLPADWIGVVVDGARSFVARTLGGETVVGRRSSDGLRSAMAANAEGFMLGYTVEGIAVYTAHRVSETSGWGTAIGVPERVVSASSQRILLAFAGGAILALLAALALALRLGQKLVEPIALLALRTRDLGREVTAPATTLAVAEIEQLGRAMDQARAAIRRRDALEAELALLLESERTARKEAEFANASKDEFMAMLGHELRNPLAVISNAVHILASGKPQFTERAVRMISENNRHLSRLIDDLLDVGRMSTGKIFFSASPVCFSEIINQTLDSFIASGKQHRIICAIEPDVWVSGDPTRLQQIVGNIVSNAFRYTPKNGLIEVTLSLTSTHCELIVRDNGMGMPEDLVPRVFELFVQGEQALSRANSGLGIGLTLVKRLVEMHGGTVTAASGGTGAGSTFTVVLPRIEKSTVESTTGTVSKDRAVQARTVVIVEDNRDGRESLLSTLEGAGHRVYAFADGDSGLNAILALTPDVAVIDIGLPDIDGYQLAMRARSAVRPPVMIAISGYARTVDAAMAFDAGFAVCKINQRKIGVSF